MKKRQKVDSKKSKAEFSRTASVTHRKNVADAPMRGGIRL